MNIKRYLDFRLLGLTGSTLLILSQFLPWFSNQSLLLIYIISSNVAIEDAFLYLFPIVSGIICLIGSVLVIYDSGYKINSVIITFIGLGFLLFFLFDLIPKELLYIPNAGVGFYFCITGFLLSILNIVIILLSKEQ